SHHHPHSFGPTLAGRHSHGYQRADAARHAAGRREYDARLCARRARSRGLCLRTPNTGKALRQAIATHEAGLTTVGADHASAAGLSVELVFARLVAGNHEAAK